MGRGVRGLVKINETCPRMEKRFMYHLLLCSKKSRVKKNSPKV
jgi:hypothetical protein